MHQTLSSGSKLSSCSSTCCGPDVCDIRTSYSLPPEGTSYCWSLPPEGTSCSCLAGPCLLRGLATAGPCLLRGLAAPALLVLVS
ncbi:hypothetical protein Tco_0418559 [Tanacetum coccineum]